MRIRPLTTGYSFLTELVAVSLYRVRILRPSTVAHYLRPAGGQRVGLVQHRNRPADKVDDGRQPCAPGGAPVPDLAHISQEAAQGARTCQFARLHEASGQAAQGQGRKPGRRRQGEDQGAQLSVRTGAPQVRPALGSLPVPLLTLASLFFRYTIENKRFYSLGEAKAAWLNPLLIGM